MSDAPYLRPREVAALLSVSVRTVLNMIERGDLRSARIGRQHRIPREDVERLLRPSSPPTPPR